MSEKIQKEMQDKQRYEILRDKTLDIYPAREDILPDEMSDDYYNKYDYFYENLLKKKLSIPKHKVELIKFCEYAQIYGYKEKNVGKNK